MNLLSYKPLTLENLTKTGGHSRLPELDPVSQQGGSVPGRLTYLLGTARPRPVPLTAPGQAQQSQDRNFRDRKKAGPGDLPP